MSVPNSIHDYLRMFAGELGERILQSFPALHNAHDPVSPRLATLLRKPFPAQAVAAMGIAKKWERERSAAVIAECGTGKTLISLAALHVHSDGRPFTAIVMAPGHLTLKWSKEALETIPRLRVFLIDGLRDRVRDSSTPCGVNEVKLRRGQIVREGCTPRLPIFACVRITRAPVRAGSRRYAQDRRCSWSGGTKASCPTFGGTHTRLRAPDATWGAWSTRIRACGWSWASAG